MPQPPEPIMRRSIAPRAPNQEEHPANALSRLAKDDRSLRVKCDAETGETFVYGTIRKKAIQEGKFIRHSRGTTPFGHCVLAVEPAPNGSGFSFDGPLSGARFPPEFVPAAEKGVRAALKFVHCRVPLAEMSLPTLGRGVRTRSRRFLFL